MLKANSNVAIDAAVFKKDTIPPANPQTHITTLAEGYTLSYEMYMALSRIPIVYGSEDNTALISKADAWADMVVLGAALREQSLQKQIEEQVIQLEDLEIQVAESGLRTLGTL
jgi:hypothetical protein